MIFAVCQSVMSLLRQTPPVRWRHARIAAQVPKAASFSPPFGANREVTIFTVDVQTDVVQRLNLAVVGADFFKR